MNYSLDTNRPLSNYHNAIDKWEDEPPTECPDCGNFMSYDMVHGENYCPYCESKKSKIQFCKLIK